MKQAEVREMWLARVEDFRASGDSKLSISWLPLEAEEAISDSFLAVNIGRYTIEEKPSFDRF